ncbi:PIG-L deacetylase family protein [Pseudooceanicola sp.]|uniref:PIG-L deacetylase family protein n=1 Tax=Pseudooceanicola sp. TaxID=1914328 RepID=UPI0035C7085E
MTNDVLVVAAHSDDEALGCAGTIARYAREGRQVHVVFLTDGVGARGSATTEQSARQQASRAATDVLGVTSVTQLSFPDNQIDSVPLLQVVQAIEEVARPLAPQIVFTHHGGDLNVDHRLCNQAVLTAFRPEPGQSVEAVYGFEVASSTEWAFGTAETFVPQHFVDISPTLELKMRALAAYDAEMRPFPHARSREAVRALAIWRGASVGLNAAEAFSVLRTIDRWTDPEMPQSIK